MGWMLEARMEFWIVLVVVGMDIGLLGKGPGGRELMVGEIGRGPPLMIFPPTPPPPIMAPLAN